MWTSNSRNLGEIQETSTGNWFTYRATENEWAIAHGFTHEIDVGEAPSNNVRFASIRKTRMKVVVDESFDGSPVVETWILKKSIPYTLNGVAK